MGLGQLGSVSNPSWAGWDWPGSGFAYAMLVQAPGFDIKIMEIHGYFNTHNGNGAHGWLCLWWGSTGHPLMYSRDIGIINNSPTGAGAGQWWVDTTIGNANPPYLLPANTFFWIGGYSNQGLIFSTYDTSPHAVTQGMGTGGPTDLNNPADTGQGPPGAYIIYSQLVYPGGGTLGPPQTLGANGTGLAKKSGIVQVQSGLATVGENTPSGIAAVNSVVQPPGSAYIGSMGGGLAPEPMKVKVPTLRVWRPN